MAYGNLFLEICLFFTSVHSILPTCSSWVNLWAQHFILIDLKQRWGLNKKNYFASSVVIRVSYETSFDSKQPKLEPKLVSILSETRRLVRLFRFNIETASFGVSIEPKQNKNNRNKQRKDIEKK
jgi:hypothetical protein